MILRYVQVASTKLQALHGESNSRRSKRSVNEHFQLDEIELDRRTYNYLKNTTEHCIISKDEIELTNLMCHNVFVCKEEQCALPQPSSDVVYRVCAKNGSPKGHNCKIGKLIFNPCGLSDQIVASLNFAKNKYAERS